MKEVNIILFGVGNVGNTLIDQFLKIGHRWADEFEIKLKIPVVANSGKALFKPEGIGEQGS